MTTNELYGEPNMEKARSFIAEKNSYKKIKKDQKMLYHLLYCFEKDNVPSFIREINKFSNVKNESEKNTEMEIIFNNLCYLYPLSKNLISQILEEEGNKSNDNYTKLQNKFLEIYVNKGRLVNCLKDFVQCIKKNDFENTDRIKHLEDDINYCEEKIKERKNEIKEREEKEIEKNECFKEVKKLEKEIELLDEKYSPQKLNTQKNELQKKKANLEKNRKEFEKIEGELQSILKEIKQFSNTDSQKTTKKLKEETKKLSNGE